MHCFLIDRLRYQKLHNYGFRDNQSDVTLSYLNLIKQIFRVINKTKADEQFKQWLALPHEKGLYPLHEISKWSPTLFDLMLERNFITQQESLMTNSYENNPIDLSKMYRKFYNREFEITDRDFLKKIKLETPEFFDREQLMNIFIAYVLEKKSTESFKQTLIDDLLTLHHFNFTDMNGNTLLHRLLNLFLGCKLNT